MYAALVVRTSGVTVEGLYIGEQVSTMLVCFKSKRKLNYQIAGVRVQQSATSNVGFSAVGSTSWSSALSSIAARGQIQTPP